MYCYRLASLAAVVVLMGVAANAVTAKVAEDRMLVVDGERTFVIGLYENPGDDALVQEVSKAGFNLVRASAEAAALDRLHAHNLWAWINTGYNIDFSEDQAARQAALESMAAELGEHPALLVWEVPDEALWNCFYRAIQWRRNEEPAQLRAKISDLDDAALQTELREMMQHSSDFWRQGRYAEAEETANAVWRKLDQEPPRPDFGLSNAPERAAKMCAGMIQGYEFLKKLDPQHPIWMNHAPRNQLNELTAFNRAADIVGCDIYPVPVFETGHSDLAERTLAAVGAYTARMQAAAPGKPVWMVLQGFGWRDLSDNPSPDSEKGRRPTLEETRFMAYDAIVHGARGVLYWGTSRIEKDSRLWADLLTVINELKALQPILSAPDASGDLAVGIAETFGSVDRGIRILPKAVSGKVWFLVVNDWTDPLTYTIGGLDSFSGVRYVENYTEDEATVRDGKLTFTLPGQRVHVLIPE
ncbi:MAG: hypothetical protein R6V12_09155 [Candidatus Hydrogenedentota bacterium]